jgi:hypothetical protein
MKRSTIILTVAWVALIVAFAGLIWHDETVVKPTKAAAFEALSATEKRGLIPVCLDGVEYWMNPGAHSRSWMLSPKYSPGNAVPDTCDI